MGKLRTVCSVPGAGRVGPSRRGAARLPLFVSPGQGVGPWLAHWRAGALWAQSHAQAACQRLGAASGQPLPGPPALRPRRRRRPRRHRHCVRTASGRTPRTNGVCDVSVQQRLMSFEVQVTSGFCAVSYEGSKKDGSRSAGLHRCRPAGPGNEMREGRAAAEACCSAPVSVNGSGIIQSGRGAGRGGAAPWRHWRGGLARTPAALFCLQVFIISSPAKLFLLAEMRPAPTKVAPLGAARPADRRALPAEGASIPLPPRASMQQSPMSS